MIAESCEENGFQLVNDEGVWRVGDALLMNMNR
jgi:predicted signal transduction protein with EAL and GGDEF domain